MQELLKSVLMKWLSSTTFGPPYDTLFNKKNNTLTLYLSLLKPPPYSTQSIKPGLTTLPAIIIYRNNRYIMAETLTDH